MDVESRHRAAVLFSILILLIGGLGLLSAGLSAAQPKSIQGVITEKGDPTSFLIGVDVTLLDARGQKDPVVVFTVGGGTYTFTPESGFYYITASKAGFFDNSTTVFRFDNTMSLFKDIQMEGIPTAVHTLTVHVEDDTGSNLTGASVEIFSDSQSISQNTTDGMGNATFTMALWTGAFEVRVEKTGYEMNVTTIDVTGDTVLEVTLNPGIKLVGWAREPDGSFVEGGLLAYLYNNDTPTEAAKRLIMANISGSSYTFYAYPGNFTLIVDASEKAANITSILVFQGMSPQDKLIDRVLDVSPDERIDTEIQYIQGDWNNVTLWRNVTLNRDSGIPGLPFSFLRDLRLQIDVALGNGDGELSDTEIGNFQDWVLESGPKHVDTRGFLTTNGEDYISDLTNGATDYGVAVNMTGERTTIVTWTNYTVVGDFIPGDREMYYINITAGHDTLDTVLINSTYSIHIVDGYERVSVDVTGSVNVTGYTTVVLDPALAPDDFAVRMVVERSLNGTVRMRVIGPPDRLTELNVSAENYTALVPTDVNVTFSAEESTDPNSPDGRVSPDSNFTWTFVNDSVLEPIIVYGIEPEAMFTVMGNYSGNLTIGETGGNVTYGNLTLLVDGLLPTATIENNVTGLGTPANSMEIEIKEDVEVRFFGGNSTDMVHDGLAGEIREWRWDLDGDGEVDATGKTVVWSFQDVGNFTVNLTVVDQAGHESANATMWVITEDITPPAVEFEILDEEFEEAISIVEDSTYYFDASGTTDNFDSIDEMDFDWAFGDGSTATGSNVTHVYADYGNYEVTLNVTDTAGNLGNATRQIVVQVEATSRPDLEIETNSLSIEPRNPEESTLFGQVLVTIRLNVTNKEDRAAAKTVQVTFWAFRFGESPGEPILIDPTFLTEDGGLTNNTLDPGEKKTVEFTWATPAQGNYTLRVNVTDLEEPDLFIGPNNSAQTQIDVRQAGWKTPLTIAAIVGVIAGIPTAIYLRRRFRGRLKERITKKLTKK